MVPFLTGCQTERTATVFGLSQGISDSATDPERLNRELEDALHQSELKRLEKLQTAPKPKSKEKPSEGEPLYIPKD